MNDADFTAYDAMFDPARNPGGVPASPEEDADYEAHLAALDAAMCPEVRALEAGYDDPMTKSVGGAGALSDAIWRHIRRCSHAWCVEESGR